tara:strand:- start:427 stop:675 length:249 start_codon:yes stop_codon:yes gene_type:complete
MTKEFKYYHVTATSMDVLEVYMKVPASINEEDVYREAREIDGGCYVSNGGDWQFDEVVEVDEKMEWVPKNFIEYTMEDFKND